MNGAIVCQELTKQYGTRKVVDSLSLSVPDNCVFGFLGPNGAGKSTTMKMLTGQIRPTAGSAWIAGVEMRHHALQTRLQTGYLSELPNFYHWMRGQELLEFTGELFGLRPAERRARAKELLQLVGLGDSGRQKVGNYSGGMRQRLGIAQALVNRPKVVFLDEPVSALDPAGRRDVLQMLTNIRQEATVFMSSHVLADVDRACERVAILNHGRLVASGLTVELKESYARPVIVIELDGGQPAAHRLASALGRESWLRQIEPAGNGSLRVELLADSLAGEAGRRLPQLVAEMGLSLLGYKPAVPNLEDVFLHLVGQPVNSVEPVSAREKAHV